MDHLEEQIEESFGPGSDLMISLFAIAILLLGIAGAGSQYGAVEEQVNDILYPVEDEQNVRKPEPPVMQAPANKAPPPLLLASQTELREVKQKQALAEKSLTRLRKQSEQQRDRMTQLSKALERARLELDEKTQKLQQHQDLLTATEEKLRTMRNENIQDRLDIVEYEIGLKDLASFIDREKELYVDLAASTVGRVHKAISPYPPGANQLYIETTVPPGLLSFVGPDLDGAQAMGKIYMLSSALAQAYQQSFLRKGMPLACITLLARGFEDSPEVRREIMQQAHDALEAFAELLTFYRTQTPAAVQNQTASVRLLLGRDQDRKCTSDQLQSLLTALTPE